MESGLPEASLEPLGGRALELNQRVVDVLGIAPEAPRDVARKATQLLVLLEPGSIGGRERLGHARSVPRRRSTVKAVRWK